MASNKMRTPLCAELVLRSVLVAAAALAQDVSFIARLQFPVGGDPRSIAVGDFNRDGLPDLAVANVKSNNVSVLINDTRLGDLSFQPSRNFLADNEPYSIGVGDFNRDGLPDLAVANAVSNNVVVLINNTRP